MKKSKKLLGVTTIVSVFGLMVLGGCAKSSGITHVGNGKVAVSLNASFPFPQTKTPILYDCSSGSTCVRIGN